jgi:alcohol dehydrogenase class IV
VNFEFAAPGRIVFGAGKLAEAGALAAALGSRALVVEGRAGRATSLVALLGAHGVAATRFGVAGEPTTAVVEQGVAEARRAGCDLVVALGGGSVIDAAKAIAALLTNPGALHDYLEVVGHGRPLTARAAPLLAIPTTAGTGAEVTRNAVLMVEEERVKVSLRSPLMLPTVALVDPALTHTLPRAETASTGLDALTQCLEPIVTPQGSPLPDALAREGMGRAARALRRAWHDGEDADARRDMAVASLCGGLALANARLGAVHGFAAPLGGMFPVPHGVACARLLAPVVAVNVRALRRRDPDSPALARYDEAARVLTGRPDARAEDAAPWLAELAADLGVPAPAAVAAGVAATTLFGLANGALVTFVRLPPFIVTLGTLNVAFALTQLYSDAQTVTEVPAAMTALGNTFRVGATPVVYGAAVMLALYAAAAFALRETAWGRHVYAVGGAPEAARLAGIHTRRVLLGVYALAGLLYGVAALLLVARTGVGDPNAGQAENLETVTAVVLGGTSLFGGRGLVLGSLVGALIVGVFRNGLTLMGVPSVYQVLVTGVLVILAVAADQLSRRGGR